MTIKSYSIMMQPFYDEINTSYKHILVINKFPEGPLANLVRKLNTPKLSPFIPSYLHKSCVYAIYNDQKELMHPDDIPDLFGYLIEHGYKIDTSLTKMMNCSDIKHTNKLVCYITLN